MPGRVLVVDDLAPNVKLLEVKLTKEYYNVVTAMSGKEALAKVKDVSPDIILLDVMMPEMDGFEVCRRLKKDPATTLIPVVMVTALSEQEDRVRGLEAGASDFITKPIDDLHLLARVRSLVRLKVMIDELRLRDKTGSELGLIDQNPLHINPDDPASILIIDDDVVQSKRIQEVLSALGHVTQECHAESAETAVAKGSYDLIIINTELDDTDGLRLGMHIRSQEKNRKIPLMMLVNEDDREVLVKGLEIGIDEYLATPLDPNELIARVRIQLRRKRYQDALRSNVQESISASIIDSLTKLYNRRYLDSHLKNLVDDSLNKGAVLSLMTIDIDHFKDVNDRPGWGHSIGDEVLKQVAERIQNNIRTTDLATRPGGEEFIVVMPNTDIQTAAAIAERIRGAVESVPFRISADPFSVTCTISIGVSNIAPGSTPEDIMKRSDEALYKAKSSGRNRVVVWQISGGGMPQAVHQAV